VYSNEDYLITLMQEAGLLNEEQAQEALSSQRSSETKVDALLRSGYVSEEDLAQTCASNASMEYLPPTKLVVSPDIIELVPEEVARRYRVVPAGFDNGRLILALDDPFNFETLDSLPHIFPYELDLRCTTPSALKDALVQCYGETDKDVSDVEKSLGEAGGMDKSVDANDAPIIKMVSQMLVEAFQLRASDIHIEPLERTMRVRYRIDGVLQEVANHPRKLLSAVISRVKIMTGTMSIAEKRVPQDGRIQLQMGERDLDLRVSTVPTNHGESVVMRILDKGGLELGLPELGFLSDDQETFEGYIHMPDGIVLVTGPTGSGKTTTLYACLNQINKPDRKIITVEDPVEYQMSGINQVQVKEEVGMSFASALRAMLRQAPNIVMIGEIRDAETANIAINAALTGHLVFSTLHTNDAPSSIARLEDIGVKPFLIASALRAVLAQRLVRKLCKTCKEPSTLSDLELRGLNLEADSLEDATIMGAKGCEKCNDRGYRGRMGIFELFAVDDEVRHMINEHLPTSQLRKRSRELGMRTMREDGIRKILAGQTTASEVLHVTMGDEQ